jgi:hypothetical protein
LENELSFKLFTKHVKNILSLNRTPEKACPVCSTEIIEENCKIIRGKISDLAENEPRWFEFFYKGSQEKAFDSLARSSYGWACDSCLSSEAALIADYKKQEFLDWPPYLAYVDQSLTCRTCGSKFTFSKEEQLYWYETLGFWVQSRAVNCKSCRKALRESKIAYAELQKEAQNIKTTIDLEDVEQVSRLISLYERTGSHKKVEFYTAVLKKLEKKKASEHNDNQA